MIVAGDEPSELLAAIERLRPGQDDDIDAPETIWEEQGETRHDLPGHEHFASRMGFRSRAFAASSRAGPRFI